MGDKLTPEELAEFREIFNLVDKDGGGTISKEELGEHMETLGIDATPEEIDALQPIIQKRVTSIRWWTTYIMFFFGISMTALAAFAATACFETREDTVIETPAAKAGE